jgi:hypothetical protein
VAHAESVADNSPPVSHTRAVSLILTIVTTAIGVALLAVLLGLNPGHSFRVRSAWLDWYQSPTAENKKRLDIAEERSEKEYNVYRVFVTAFIFADGYLVYRSLTSNKRAIRP